MRNLLVLICFAFAEDRHLDKKCPAGMAILIDSNGDPDPLNHSKCHPTRKAASLVSCNNPFTKHAEMKIKIQKEFFDQNFESEIADFEYFDGYYYKVIPTSELYVNEISKHYLTLDYDLVVPEEIGITGLVFGAEKIITFSCMYPREIETSSGFKVDNVDSEASRTSFGMLEYHLKVYNSKLGVRTKVEAVAKHYIPSLGARFTQCKIESNDDKLFPIHSFAGHMCVDPRIQVQMTTSMSFTYKSFMFDDSELEQSQNKTITCRLQLYAIRDGNENDHTVNAPKCDCFTKASCTENGKDRSLRMIGHDLERHMSGLYGSHDTKPADPAAEYDNVQHGKLEGSKRPSNGKRPNHNNNESSTKPGIAPTKPDWIKPTLNPIKPHHCPGNKFWNPAGNKCNDFYCCPDTLCEPRRCTKETEGRCECPEGLVIDPKDINSCISKEKACSNDKKCPGNKIWNDCGSKCDDYYCCEGTVCDLPFCTKQCEARCQCPPGLVPDPLSNFTCIQQKDACAMKCGENEIWSKCHRGESRCPNANGVCWTRAPGGLLEAGPGFLRPQNKRERRDHPGEIIQEEPEQSYDEDKKLVCFGKCECKKGYARNKANQCVRFEECNIQKPICQKNEHFVKCSYCSDPKCGEERFCTGLCENPEKCSNCLNENKCVCNKGFKRYTDPIFGHSWCVEEERCPE